jgi:hypothetical protein
LSSRKYKGIAIFSILIFTAAAVNENLFNFDIKEHMPLTEMMGDIKNIFWELLQTRVHAMREIFMVKRFKMRNFVKFCDGIKVCEEFIDYFFC